MTWKTGVKGYLVGPCQSVPLKNHAMWQTSYEGVIWGQEGSEDLKKGRGRQTGAEPWGQRRGLAEEDRKKDSKIGYLGTHGNREAESGEERGGGCHQCPRKSFLPLTTLSAYHKYVRDVCCMSVRWLLWNVEKTFILQQQKSKVPRASP